MKSKVSLMVSAGEASGDMHAAHMLASLKKRGLPFSAFGMGANKLAEQGMELTLDCRELSVIGIVDVLINYHKFLRRLKALRDELRRRKPDLLIIVDYPDFNLKLAETAKALGIPVLFYISPQVWAWRKKRIAHIGSLVTHMAVLFPFEVDVYENANIPVTYVGHPLVDDAHCAMDQQQAQQYFGLSTHNPVVALLPGSRSGELSRNLPVMLSSAAVLSAEFPTCQFIVPVAPTLDRQEVQKMLDEQPIRCELVDGNSYCVMRAADAVLTASGTATLETAMLGTPMCIMYVVNTINYAIMRRLIQIDNIGLVNIVAGQTIVREYVQNAAKAESIASELSRLITDNEYRGQMQQALAEVQQKMGSGGASDKVATLVESMLSH